MKQFHRNVWGQWLLGKYSGRCLDTTVFADKPKKLVLFPQCMVCSPSLCAFKPAVAPATSFGWDALPCPGLAAC